MPLSLAGATLGSSIITGIGGLFGQRSTAKSAKRDINFQREMSQNKYQYMMNDMANAGLNPILAAQGGSPGVGGAGGGQIPYMNPFGEAISSGMDVYKAGKQGERVDADVGLKAQQVITSSADANLKGYQMSVEKEREITEIFKQVLMRAQASNVDVQQRRNIVITDLLEQLADFKVEIIAGSQGKGNIISEGFNNFVGGLAEGIMDFIGFGKAKYKAFKAGRKK